MTVLRVIEGEREELRQTSRSIDSIDESVFELAQNLLETMRAYHVASLSAPQCGHYVNMFVTDVLGRQQVWLNPEVMEAEGQVGSVESCASFPDLNLEVMRPIKLVVRSLELNGSTTTRTLSGIQARLVAHEIDHLNGVIFHDLLDADTLFDQMLNSVETTEKDMESSSLEDADDDVDSYANGADDGNDVADDGGDDDVDSFTDDVADDDGEDDLRQMLDLLADGVWKITLAVELLKEFELEQSELDELLHLEQLGESLSQSTAYFESLFGDDM